MPLDEDEQHASYDRDQVATYFAAATQAALVLAAYRAPYRGRSTPVNAWWGSFDLAVSLFSGASADPPSDDFIMRNAMDAQEVAVGWWPGDPRHDQAAFYAYAHPAPEGFAQLALSPPAAHWDAALGEYILEWDDFRSAPDPARGGPGLRPLRVPPGLRGLRLGHDPGRERRRNPAARQVKDGRIRRASGLSRSRHSQQRGTRPQSQLTWRGEIHLLSALSWSRCLSCAVTPRPTGVTAHDKRATGT